MVKPKPLQSHPKINEMMPCSLLCETYRFHVWLSLFLNVPSKALLAVLICAYAVHLFLHSENLSLILSRFFTFVLIYIRCSSELNRTASFYLSLYTHAHTRMHAWAFLRSQNKFQSFNLKKLNRIIPLSTNTTRPCCPSLCWYYKAIL